MEQDGNAYEDCDGDRVDMLLKEYRPGKIPFRAWGPLEKAS